MTNCFSAPVIRVLPRFPQPLFAVMLNLRAFRVSVGLLALAFITVPAFAQPVVLPAPPQNQGLPYTRSAHAAALAKLGDHIAVFAGSRYGYVQGYKTRLDPAQLRSGEAVWRDGVVLVPAAFAVALDLGKISPVSAPDGLDNRWVYDVGLKPAPTDTSALADLAALAQAKGLIVSSPTRGLLIIGRTPVVFSEAETGLLDSVITLFDTPEKFADPDIATRALPAPARQGKWTDHVKASPAQLAVLAGPETVWPTVPKSSYDLTGFNAALLGSAVPAPGVYPRLLFTEQDLPALAARVKSSRMGQLSLIEQAHLFAKSWWDPTTSDGQIFKKLYSGDLAGLEWEAAPGTPLNSYPHSFKGQKPGIYNSHVAYVPECLTSMALYCLLTGDEARGRQVGAAVANYYKLREPLVDQWLKISDSEFASSTTDVNGVVVNLNGAGASTHWRNIHGLVAHMNLALSLDFAGKWMNAAEKETMRRVIAKATYGRRSYAQDAPVRFRDVNWMGWDLPHFLAVAAIEGLPGFDPEAYESGAESIRAFCDWGIDDSGVVFESNGKTPGSFQFIFLSMITLARRGENLFGHPHWRKLLDGQIQMTSPNGQVIVNSGTQYTPYSRQEFSLQLASELKSFFPADRRPDYLVTKAISQPGADTDEYHRTWPRSDFAVETYSTEVALRSRLRLPSLTYPGFVRGILYDSDTVPTTRADLNLPLDFNAPTQGVFSSYSDRTPEAAWINLYVRPHHYLGAGHHHADAGMFHFSALGVDWFTQSPFHQAFNGEFFNLVQVDGKSEPTSVPSAGILGYNGPATYLGAITTPHASIGSADLTYAYSWRWLTQPPQVWSAELKAMGWELEPSAENLRIWAGTDRYKLRPWWANYNYSNYIPTSRAPFNPMRHVFRSTALIRGQHAYGLVIDDLQKDDAPHLYQWAAMLNGGVWHADVGGLPANSLALGFRAGDPDDKFASAPVMITPAAGEPLLLVVALGLDASGDPQKPLVQVERISGPNDKKGGATYFNRLVVNRRDVAVNYRTLLLPVRAGEPLPVVAYDATQSVATVSWPGGQTDMLTFTVGGDARSHLSARRGDTVLLP